MVNTERQAAFQPAIMEQYPTLSSNLLDNMAVGTALATAGHIVLADNRPILLEVDQWWTNVVDVGPSLIHR